VGKIKLGSRKSQKSSLLLLRFDTSFEIGKLECSEVNRISEHSRHQLAIGDQLVMQLLQQLRSDATIRADIPYIFYRLYRESHFHFLQGIDPLCFCTKYSKRQRLETSSNPLASKPRSVRQLLLCREVKRYYSYSALCMIYKIHQDLHNTSYIKNDANLLLRLLPSSQRRQRLCGCRCSP
jgi:hypothetical protein